MADNEYPAALGTWGVWVVMNSGQRKWERNLKIDEEGKGGQSIR